MSLIPYPAVITPEEPLAGAVLPDRQLLNSDFTLARNDYAVRLAYEQSPLHARTRKLIRSMYGSRGLGTVETKASTLHPGQHRAKRIVLAAFRGQDLVGTLTLGVDPGPGLLADSLYRLEIDAMRLEGKRLCEVTQLALHPELSCREVLATLFQVTFALACAVHDRTDLVAEVHPRHAAFYRRSLGFRIVGPERVCMRVGAPAMLIHLCLDHAREQIDRFAGTSTHGYRNLYSLFMSPSDHEILLKQLIV